MLFEIPNRAGQQIGLILEMSESSVAVMAKQPPHLASDVIVVNA